MAKAPAAALSSYGASQLINFSSPEGDPSEILHMTPETDKMVKGIFRFLETPGGTMMFNFGAQYKGQPVKFYKLQDGQVYEIPLSVKKHLNSQVRYEVHSHLQDPSGNPLKGVGKRVARCEFRSID